MLHTSRRQDTEQRDIDALEAELKHFREEKEKVRRIIGEIGGKASNERDRLVNIVFILLLLLLALLTIDVLRHYVSGLDWFPPIVSLEIGVLLVSLKIIWMIHKQAKVEHFQFWILNSIEFRLTELSRHVTEMQQNQD